MATRWKKELKKGNISQADAYRIKNQSDSSKGSFQDYVKKENQILSQNRDSTGKLVGAMRKGFQGMGEATQKAGNAAKSGAGMMGGLAAGAYRTVTSSEKTGSIMIILFPVLLWILDYYSGVNGIRWDSIFNYAGLDLITQILSKSPFILVLVIYFIIRKPNTKEELSYYFFLVFLLVTIWMFARTNFWIFYHLIFALGVYVFLLKGLDRSTAIDGRHWLFLFVVIWDIFAFPSAALLSSAAGNEVLSVISNKLLFPIWLIYFSSFIREGSDKNTLLILIWMFYLGFVGWQIIGGGILEQTSAEQREAALAAPKKVFSNYASLWGKWISGQIQYAITGKVEENQYEPLGVYLEDVKSAQQRFYTDEPVVVWGNVRARTLDDPINLKVGCFVEEDEKKTEATKIDPDKTFSVFTFEEQDFACTFRANILESGSKTITTHADFNFETLALLKTYFMDRERLRAMTRQNQDPFEEFDIKDKSPIAIYTNGPAEIGIETTSPLIGVSDSYLALPRIRMSIQNRQGWEGKITALKELILLTPKGASIANPQLDCNQKFNNYELDDCKEKSCKEFVFNECNKVCKGHKEGSTEYLSCQQTCKEESEQCQDECNALFQEENQEYNAYSLDIKALESKIQKKEDLERFTFFTCSINPNPSEVLGNTPITTKSFRVKARYDYSVEKTVAVRIDKVPGLDDATQESSGGRAIMGSTEMENKIIQIANQQNFENPVLLLSIARVESSLEHCKLQGSSCGTSMSLSVNCNAYGSCGLMQINKDPKAHQDLFQAGSKRLQEFGCASGETAYDLDCNIKSAIGILRQYYRSYGEDSSNYNSKVDNTCSKVINPLLNTKYKSYTNPWDRTARAYNGFGCTAGADTDYVEEVKNTVLQYQAGVLKDTVVLAPTNIKVTKEGQNALLTWTLSADDGKGSNDVVRYNIYRRGRYSTFDLIGSSNKGLTTYTDTTADFNNKYDYYYKIEVQDQNENKKDSIEVRLTNFDPIEDIESETFA